MKHLILGLRDVLHWSDIGVTITFFEDVVKTSVRNHKALLRRPQNVCFKVSETSCIVRNENRNGFILRLHKINNKYSITNCFCDSALHYEQVNSDKSPH